jgi:hypothetical protein
MIQPAATITSPSEKDISSWFSTKIKGKKPKIMQIRKLKRRGIVDVSLSAAEIIKAMSKNNALKSIT